MSEALIKADSQQLATTEKPSMLQAVMQAAMNPNLDPDRIEKFLNMARDLEQDQKRQEFLAAFAAAHREISQIKILKNGEIIYPPTAKSPSGSVVKFIKHDDISRAIKPVMVANGLTATYSSEVIETPPKTVVVMTIIHANGYSRDWRSVPMPTVDSGGGKNDVQGAVSVSTYGRRSVTIQAFDIVAEGADDDGNLGRGAPVVTNEQAQTIDDILSALDHRNSGRRAQFMTWVEKQFRVSKIYDLQQGAQFEEVMSKLDAAQKRDGIKK